MNPLQVLDICTDLLFTTLLLIAPIAIVSLVSGLVISVIQTVTSVQEPTLTFVPKLLAVGGVIVLTLGWTLRISVEFTFRMVEMAADVGR